VVALAALIVGFTAVAFAGSIPAGDPVVRTGGGTGSVPINSSTFTIFTATGSSPTDGTPCVLLLGSNSTPAPECIFQNDIGTNGDMVHELVVISSQDFAGSITCALSTALGGQSLFTRCDVIGNEVLFYGGPGIPFGTDFSFGFRGFDLNASFSVTATTVPEPGTLVLLTGISALLVRRRSPDA